MGLASETTTTMVGPRFSTSRIFSDDSNVLYHNDGDGQLHRTSPFQTGLGEPSIPFLGWGTSFLDYDNDGWS
jgi:hypothetical protein